MRIYVQSTEIAKTKTGSPYLRMRYVDESKVQKVAVLFDSDSKEFDGKVCEAIINAASPSDRVDSLSIIPDADIRPFVKNSKFDSKMMIEEIRQTVSGFDPILVKIVEAAILAKGRVEKFSDAPAAANKHHAFVGGLLEHTWAMVKMAKAIMDADPALEGIDKQVVLTAVILHDMAKIFTYDSKHGRGERNNLDVLLGHICIADEIVVKTCVANDHGTTKGPVLNLRHCILSHHGKLEWGSPVVPSTREAVFLHYLDNMQARNQMAMESISGIAKGARSPKNHSLETEVVNL